MFSCVFSGNTEVKAKAKRFRVSSLIERRQQDGKDISHNSDAEGGVGTGEDNRSRPDKKTPVLGCSGDAVAVQWRRGEGSSRRGLRHRPGAGQLRFDSTEGRGIKEPAAVLQNRRKRNNPR